MKQLVLSNAAITDQEIKEILFYLESIDYRSIYVDLDCNNISDDGFQALINFEVIKEINLDRNNITNNGLKDLFTRKNNSLK